MLAAMMRSCCSTSGTGRGYLTNVTAAYLLVVAFNLQSLFTNATETTSFLTEVESRAQFEHVLSSNAFTFVKFYNPACIHCQQMAPAFVKLSSMLFTRNHNATITNDFKVATVAVDITKERNDQIVNKFEISAVPTLLLIHRPDNYRSADVDLYHSSISSEEHTGERSASAMFDFIINAISVSKSPQYPHISSVEQLNEFVKLIGTARTTVLFYDSLEDSLSREWTEIKHHFMNDPQVKLATVSHPSLLTLPQCQQQFEYVSKLHLHNPIAFIRPSASTSRFSTHCSSTMLHWYFPHMKDSHSFSTFVHLNVMSSRKYLTLSPSNSRYILLSTLPLFLVFDKNAKSGTPPSPQTEYFLDELTGLTEPNIPITPVYVPALSFMHVLYHMRNHTFNMTNTSINDEIEVYLFMETNHGYQYEQFCSACGSISQWASQHIAQVNQSINLLHSLYTAPGHIIDLSSSAAWFALFDYEQRNVLLFLLPSADNNHIPPTLLQTMTSTAHELAHLHHKVVVASFVCNSSGTEWILPEWPQLNEVVGNDTSAFHLPDIFMVQPETLPIRYPATNSRKDWTVHEIIRFAESLIEGGETNATQGVLTRSLLDSQMLIICVSFALCGLAGLLTQRRLRVLMHQLLVISSRSTIVSAVIKTYRRGHWTSHLPRTRPSPP